MFVKHDDATVATVLTLADAGKPIAEISQRAGVSPTTVRRWLRTGGHRQRRAADRYSRPLSASKYAYLLGMYLGDGVLGKAGRTYMLRISLDAGYPRVARECAIAIASVLPARVTWRRVPDSRTLVIQSCSLSWPALFPQHGPGKKHRRRIELVPWQAEITRRFTREFLRGLVHSDGSRTINRFAVQLPSGRVGRYAYPRYFFTNLSADIRGIFCEHCELLGIHWTQSNPRNISIANRESVAILDSFVGPKE